MYQPDTNGDGISYLSNNVNRQRLFSLISFLAKLYWMESIDLLNYIRNKKYFKQR